MAVNIIKIYQDGSEAHSQTFDDAVQAELYLHKHRDSLIAAGHEVLEETSGRMVVKVGNAIFTYEVR